MSSESERSEVSELDTSVRYDLSVEEMHKLTDQLLAEREPYSKDQIICYRLEEGSVYENVARTIECEVFEQYFGNNAEEMHDEYGKYEDQSIFFLSVDQQTQTPVGVLRVIQNGEEGLKTLNDLRMMVGDEHPEIPDLPTESVLQAHEIDELDECWDVGTVAVRKEYRNNKAQAQEASVQLYRALYVSALEEGIKHFVSIIDERPFKKMVDYLGIPFEAMMGSKPFPYLGSESSYAAYGDVTKFYEKMNRKRYTVKGLLARRALQPLVKGTSDSSIEL